MKMIPNIRNVSTSRKISLSLASVFLVALLSILITLAYNLLLNDKIFQGVHVDNFHAGNLSPVDLRKILIEKYDVDLSQKRFRLIAMDQEISFTYSDIYAKLDIDAAIQSAYGIGRKGTIFSRVKDISFSTASDTYINVPIYYDQTRVLYYLSLLQQKVSRPTIDFQLVVPDDGPVKLVNGQSGRYLQEKEALEQIHNLLQNFEDGDITLKVVIDAQKPISIDSVYHKINRPPFNAYTKIVQNQIEIIPHRLGREISREDLANVLSSIQSHDRFSIAIPVHFTTPEITTETLKANLFKDSLGAFSTQFSTGSVNNDNRKINIQLSAQKINNTLLGPGETFSFNKIVGPRTPENGYQDAKSFIAGQIIDSTGGGICQVSSTLYNAVLLSDLPILARTHHMFSVGYVPLGLDAAVAYDANVDFQFKNTTLYPIKIACSVTPENQIFFELFGTLESPKKEINFRHTIIEEIPAPIEKIMDASLEKGTQKVIEEGFKGFIVDTFKITKVNGVVIQEEKLSRDHYKPFTRKLLEGTKEPAVTTLKPELPIPANASTSDKILSEPSPQQNLSED